MTPLTLGGSTAPAPRTFPALLDLLESRPQPALIWYGADQQRVELSGRVLQNWTVKLIGLFTQESEIEREEPVLVDAQAHWKATAVLLAAGALGWRVTLTTGSNAPASPDDDAARAAAATSLRPGLIITDRPGDWTGSGALADALGDAELAALSPGLLDASFEEATGQRLPAWALDISAEVRQHPDQLPAPLPARELPEPAGGVGGRDSSGGQGDSGGGGLVVVGGPTQASWQDWQLTQWSGADGSSGANGSDGSGGLDLLGQMLQTWAHNRPVVLFQGDPAVETAAWEQMLRNEGIG